MHCTSSSRQRRRRWIPPLIALLSTLSAVAALAHTPPRPIERWGPFLPTTVPCLQKESRVTFTCFETVYDAAQACADAQARGQTCDTSHVDDVIDAATAQTRRVLANECQTDQVSE